MGEVASQITSLTIVYSVNGLFGLRSKKTSKLHVTGLCVGNSPVTGEFPAQMASNAENVSIWCRHHETNFAVPDLQTSCTDLTTWQWRPDGSPSNGCQEKCHLFVTMTILVTALTRRSKRWLSSLPSLISSSPYSQSSGRSVIAFNSSTPGQNGRHFADDIFRCIFVNEKFCILIKTSLKFALKCTIDNNRALV